MSTDEEAERPCPRCGEIVDDVWMVIRNDKPEEMCPGCVAKCRSRGDEVRTT